MSSSENATVSDEPVDGPVVGRVIGTDDATPMEFWVAVEPGSVIQLDDVLCLSRELPDGMTVDVYGVVNQVRARHDGARFDADVFDIAGGYLPAQVSEAAQVITTRYEPERYVAPVPGSPVRRAVGVQRDRALFFDTMTKRLPVGLGKDGEPVYANLEFIDGTRGGHINISGISGVAAKTSAGTWFLYSLLNSGVVEDAANTRALVFSVKGASQMLCGLPNRKLTDEDRAVYERLGLLAEPFQSVSLWAPPHPQVSGSVVPHTTEIHEGVRPYFWTLAEFCQDELLPYLFASPDDERQQYSMVVANVTARLADPKTVRWLTDAGAVKVEGTPVSTFGQLVDKVCELVLEEDDITVRDRWRGRSVGAGTAHAFVRRLRSAASHVRHLIRGDAPGAHPESSEREARPYRVTLNEQMNVVDIHQLNDRAQRFVVGVLLRERFAEAEQVGGVGARTYLMLDELNKYAPRHGTSPIAELILDVAERGRAMGLILIGCQQTSSGIEHRVLGNCAIRAVGRLDTAEASREEYAWLPDSQRKRATILKPGTLMISQPELPAPVAVEFPFPAWATRPSEADPGELGTSVFDGLDDEVGMVHLDRDGQPMPF